MIVNAASSCGAGLAAVLCLWAWAGCDRGGNAVPHSEARTAASHAPVPSTTPPAPALETPRAGGSTAAPRGDVTQQRESLGPDGRQRRVWTVKRLANGQEVEHGPWSAFYEDGQLYLDGQYLDGERHGLWTTNYPNGQLRGTGTFARGRKTGTWTHWDDQGRKRREYQCADDDFHGSWTEWDEQGRIVERGAYDRGQKHGDWIKRDANGAMVETRWDHGREAGETGMRP